jgi:hypothetical protein
MACEWCGEPVLAGERNHVGFKDMHVECGFRAVIGSVAHVLRRCSCYMSDSTLSDPPGLTKREAARAAHTLWLQVESWYGADVRVDVH